MDLRLLWVSRTGLKAYVVRDCEMCSRRKPASDRAPPPVQRHATSGCHLRSTGNAGAGVAAALDIVKHVWLVATSVCQRAVLRKQLCQVPATTIGEAVYLPPITAPAQACPPDFWDLNASTEELRCLFDICFIGNG